MCNMEWILWLQVGVVNNQFAQYRTGFLLSWIFLIVIVNHSMCSWFKHNFSWCFHDCRLNCLYESCGLFFKFLRIFFYKLIVIGTFIPHIWLSHFSTIISFLKPCSKYLWAFCTLSTCYQFMMAQICIDNHPSKHKFRRSFLFTLSSFQFM